MTRLRKMMLEELQRRNYSTITTRNYLRVVGRLGCISCLPEDCLPEAFPIKASDLPGVTAVR